MTRARASFKVALVVVAWLAIVATAERQVRAQTVVNGGSGVGGGGGGSFNGVLADGTSAATSLRFTSQAVNTGWFLQAGGWGYAHLGAEKFRIENGTTSSFQALTSTSTITSTASGSLGWSIVSAANQLCTTTCTSAAVHGWDGTTPVGPSDATADICLCAGAS